MSVTDFFGGFDIPIYQLYGMSECTGVSTYNIKSMYVSQLKLFDSQVLLIIIIIAILFVCL